MTDFAIFGAGAMATAIGNLLALNGHSVILYARRHELAKSINEKRRNIDYIPELILPEEVRATTRLDEWITASDNIILAIPSRAILDFCDLMKVQRNQLKDKNWLSVVKGINAKFRKTCSRIIIEKLKIKEENIAVLSGPNFAIEIVKQVPTINVIASKSRETINIFHDCLTTEYLVLKTSDDVIGVEIGGVLKNIGSITIGLIDGLGFGDNTRGFIFTYCLHELIEIGRKIFKAKLQTLLDLPLLGDFISTAFSQKSRNRLIGLLFSKNIRNIPDDTFISEGRHSVHVIRSLAHERGISTPVMDFVASVLSGANPLSAFHTLWQRLKEGHLKLFFE